MDLGLLYHPFFDTRHCVFRLLRLLEQIGQREVEVQRLQIWDFYLLFPDALISLTLPRGNQALQRQLKSKKNAYDVMPDAKRAFARLKPIQQAAVRHLAVKDLIDPKRLRDGKVVRTAATLPDDLASVIRERNEDGILLIKFLTTDFFDLELYGAKGVRQRTDLFDHRYDIQRTSYTT